ncbi:glucoamylase family protein [Rhodoferax sp.]|uniref:glucoamylase family protein n=1 Tax=Rhodoferax sp. TaxID=50421 RepID=UPI0025E2874B|nr:glucoamylase family protein [Rhodoferax sp.]
MPALAPADMAMLDGLQRSAFDYFVQHTNLANGLVADTSRPGSHASIAVVGFALSAYPVAVERGWMARGDAVQRSLAALRFFAHSDQSGTPEASGAHGFYFHFLHMDSGTRAWRSELSLIDSTLLVAGMLTAAAYFTAATADETELRTLADALYRRVDWRWAQHKGAAVVLGWKPESGFLHYGWQGYSEALILYVLGLGSPTHPLTAASFEAWTRTYQWENLYGYDFLYAGPLFIHQFSQAWIDFRGIHDRFMREKRCDYFENSRRATYIQREYAIRNPRSFNGLGADGWGLSAGDGPSTPRQQVAGRRQSFYGYAARGVPYGPDDGTLSGPATLASLVFAPEIVVPVVRQWMAQGGERTVLASGFNATVRTAAGEPWVSEGRFGLDQGLLVLMLENHRSGLVWQLLRSSPYIRAGLQRAGFRGGWLTP